VQRRDDGAARRIERRRPAHRADFMPKDIGREATALARRYAFHADGLLAGGKDRR